MLLVRDSTTAKLLCTVYQYPWMGKLLQVMNAIRASPTQ